MDKELVPLAEELLVKLLLYNDIYYHYIGGYGYGANAVGRGAARQGFGAGPAYGYGGPAYKHW